MEIFHFLLFFDVTIIVISSEVTIINQISPRSKNILQQKIFNNNSFIALEWKRALTPDDIIKLSHGTLDFYRKKYFWKLFEW